MSKVNLPTESGDNSLQLSSAKIQITLLNFAERQSERLSKLQSYLDKAEEQLFDETLISHLNPKELSFNIDLALRCISSRVSVTKSISDSINWEDLENTLKLLSSGAVIIEDTDESRRLELAAQELLKNIK